MVSRRDNINDNIVDDRFYEEIPYKHNTRINGGVGIIIDRGVYVSTVGFIAPFISRPGCDRQPSPLINANSIKSHETVLFQPSAILLHNRSPRVRHVRMKTNDHGAV